MFQKKFFVFSNSLQNKVHFHKAYCPPWQATFKVKNCSPMFEC